ncbi:MAG: radical SAM protein, partial [Spirochaetaceae bacterium]|nr:radical SAM protein [Spirochaetaceae bacterium]
MNQPITGVPIADLEKLLLSLPKFRAKQIFDWIQNGAESFEQMSNLPIDLRNTLSKTYRLRCTKLLNKIEDKDGTIKLQLEIENDEVIESVILIDSSERKTACLSTQAGCPMRCVFCKTGSLGFSRNLTSSEIVEQFFHIKALGNDIANIVFMGMGEPLLNLNELEKAIDVLCKNMSYRRITISTCGIISGIRSLIDRKIHTRLALSICSADEDLRRRLMPVSITNPLEDLKNALQDYQQQQGQRIT